MLIDTHAHLVALDCEEGKFGFEPEEVEGVIERAKKLGVKKIISPGTNLEMSRQSIAVAIKYPGIVYAAVGIHPEEILKHDFKISKVPNSRPEGSEPMRLKLEILNDLITQNKEQIVAVGEVGTDSNNEELTKRMSEQQELFGAQCELALRHDLPIIVHTRASLVETFAVLDKLPKMPRGQFHCFSYDEAGLREVLKRGFYVSFCGNITWSKRVRSLVKLVPKERLLLETDSPFMMPRDTNKTKVPNSGPENLPAQAGSEPLNHKSSDLSSTALRSAERSELKELKKITSSEPRVRNEPKNVKMLASFQAELRGESIEIVEKTTSENAKRVYKI